MGRFSDSRKAAAAGGAAATTAGAATDGGASEGAGGGTPPQTQTRAPRAPKAKPAAAPSMPPLYLQVGEPGEGPRILLPEGSVIHAGAVKLVDALYPAE